MPGTDDSGAFATGSAGRDPRHAAALDRRGGRLHSIQLRLLLPVAVATIGLVTLGAVQAVSAIRLAAESSKAATIAATATATVRLTHDLEAEISEADALHQRGNGGQSLVAAVRGQTDLAVTAFRAAMEPARKVAPGLRPLLDNATAQVSQLKNLRASADRLEPGQLSAPTYEELNHSLLAIADAIPELMTDVGLAATARAAAAIATAEHLGAQQRDLLRGIFSRGSFQAGELATLASLTGSENERLAEFSRYANEDQRAQYASLISGTDVTQAVQWASGALAGDREAQALKVDSDEWYIVQSNVLRRLHLLEVSLAQSLDHTARSDQALAQARALVTGVSTVGLVVLAFGTAVLLAIRTSRRLRILRGTALTVAGVELPGAISSLTEAADPHAVRAAVNAASSRAEELTVAGADEISEVGAALSAVHRQALRLAADQAGMRLDIAALFVALSRRGQTLIQRQLRLLDEFERAETDPHVLGRLFALDHLAARMRRNEENLLVLAGGEPGRRVMAPVPLIDLVRAAAAEIEDFDRVDAAGVADVGVVAHAVRDVIHLLAELLENATVFSPPTSRVRVSARRSIDSVTVSVFDEGIGMPQEQAAELNERLAQPTMLTSELAGTMGLLVVGRLAARHGITVELRSALGGGTVALAALPDAVLTQAQAVTVRTASLLHPDQAIEPPPGMETDPGYGRSLPPVAAGSAVPVAPALLPAGASREPEHGPRATELPRRAPTQREMSERELSQETTTPLPMRVPLYSSYPVPAPAAHEVPPDPPHPTAPAPAPASASNDDGQSLPRRRPGDLLLSGSAASPTDRTAPGRTQRGQTPDPDAVRARLSGLARGLAAGERRMPGAPTRGADPGQLRGAGPAAPNGTTRAAPPPATAYGSSDPQQASPGGGLDRPANRSAEREDPQDGRQ